MMRCIPLEPAAETICNQSAIPPLIFNLPVKQARNKLEKAQEEPVYLYPAKIFSKLIDTKNWGIIPVYSILPNTTCKFENVIFYIHGGGWVLGSFHTHEKLVRELAVRTNSLVVFPEYSRSPEAKYPEAIEQCYFILSHLWQIIHEHCTSAACNRLIIAGDSVGGNMAIAMAFMSMARRGPEIQKQLLYYPVTSACFNTPTYCEFAKNYYLYRKEMMWFWNLYTTCIKDRCQIVLENI